VSPLDAAWTPRAALSDALRQGERRAA